MYTSAIEANPNIAAYYANRSFAYLRTECFGYALSDASSAIKLDKGYIKGFYRRATAYMSLGKFKEALKDYEYVSIFYCSLFIAFYYLIRGTKYAKRFMIGVKTYFERPY